MIDDVWWDANTGLPGESQVWPSTQPRPPPLLTRSRLGKYIAAHRLFKSSERTQMAWGCRYILALSQRAHLASLDGGSVAKGCESSCGGKIVVAPVGPAWRWPPGEGMFSSQIKEKKVVWPPPGFITNEISRPPNRTPSFCRNLHDCASEFQRGGNKKNR